MVPTTRNVIKVTNGSVTPVTKIFLGADDTTFSWKMDGNYKPGYAVTVFERANQGSYNCLEAIGLGTDGYKIWFYYGDPDNPKDSPNYWRWECIYYGGTP